MELLLMLGEKEYEIEKLIKHLLNTDEIEYALELDKKDEISEKEVLDFFKYYKTNVKTKKANFKPDLVLDLEQFAFLIQEESLGETVLLKDMEGIFKPNGNLKLLIRKK